MIYDDFFYIKKRFQLVKTIRVSTHIDIFVEKNSKFFFEVGGGFREKAKNRQNHDLFEVAVMGVNNFQQEYFYNDAILQIPVFHNRKNFTFFI